MLQGSGVMSEEYFHASNEIHRPGTKLKPNYGITINNSRYYSHNKVNYTQYLKEQLFETVRKTKYPSLPSRLNCIYVVDDVRYALQYIQKMNKKYLYRVTIKNKKKSAKVDMNLLDCNNKSFNEVVVIADKYFSGVSSEHPFYEYLIEGTVVVENRIDFG